MIHNSFETTRTTPDLMKKHLGQIDDALYKAEQVCKIKYRPVAWTLNFGCACPFYQSAGGPQLWGRCNLKLLREIVGDRVEQHDCMPDIKIIER